MDTYQNENESHAYLEDDHPHMDHWVEDFEMEEADDCQSVMVTKPKSKKKKKKLRSRPSRSRPRPPPPSPEASYSSALPSPLPSPSHSSSLQNAAAGAAVAGIMTKAFSADCGTTKKKPWKTLAVTCAVVGVGALYLGLLYYLYKKMHSLEKSLKETMDEMKKVMDMLNNEEFMVVDEPVPVFETLPKSTLFNEHESYQIENENDSTENDENDSDDSDDSTETPENDFTENFTENTEPPKIEEIATPTRKPKPTKKRIPKKPKKPPVVVFDLDAI